MKLEPDPTIPIMRSALLILALLLPGCIAGRLGGSPPIVQAEAQAALQVARVRHEGGPGQGWWGSAVPIKCDYVGDDTYVVIYMTARHVVGDGRMWVQLFEKPDYYWVDEVHEVILKERHPNYDVALIMIQLDHTIDVLTPNYREPEPGEEIITAGYNSAESLGMAKGLVGSRMQFPTRPEWPTYQSTAYSKPGASGGAVISQGGELLGIHVAGHRDSEHKGLFIPVIRVQQWLGIRADV